MAACCRGENQSPRTAPDKGRQGDPRQNERRDHFNKLQGRDRGRRQGWAAGCRPAVSVAPCVAGWCHVTNQTILVAITQK